MTDFQRWVFSIIRKYTSLSHVAVAGAVVVFGVITCFNDDRQEMRRDSRVNTRDKPQKQRTRKQLLRK